MSIETDLIGRMTVRELCSLICDKPKSERMDIGDAIDALHDGHRLARHGWVAGCYVAMGTDDEGDRYIKMVECQDEGYWRPSQIDILTVDWYVL